MFNAKYIEQVPVSSLHANSRNARTHSAKQVAQIAASIEAFGFTNPLLIDEHDRLIAGHGRLEAANELRLTTVPVIRITHLRDTEKRLLMLADNRIALGAGWNLSILTAELADLSSVDQELSIDVAGFDAAEIDLLLDNNPDHDGGTAETAPLPDPALPVISKLGDIWVLGPHRLMCGDALSNSDIENLMEGQLADVGFTDPPFNVPIAGHVSGKGRMRHREFVQASGEMSKAEFTNFLSDALSLGATHSRDGAVWFACMDWRHIQEMTAAGDHAFDEMLNLCVWAKTNGGMGSFYRSQHELVFVFRKGKSGHRNNVQLGRYGRNRTNLWTYPGVNTFRQGRMADLEAHPTAKPVAMIRDALMDASARGEVVMDQFSGAGATLLAAEDCGRIGRCMELDRRYVDTTLRRWRTATGVDPLRLRDGIAFSHLESSAIAEVTS